MDQITMFTRACGLAQRQVEAAAGVPDAKTPCPKWSAGQLANHMVFGLNMWADIIEGNAPQGDPFDPPHILGDDMAADFKAATERVVACFNGDGFFEGTYQTPAGEMPGTAVITFPTYDMYVHAWDLEQATGLQGEHPDDLTALAMGFAKQGFTDERPPHIVGPEVKVAEDASDFDKMLAFNGRQP